MSDQEKKVFEAAKKSSMDENFTAREAYWSELPLEQKIERMRNQVKNLQSQLDGFYRLLQPLLAHSHLEGKIVVGLDEIKCNQPTGGGRYLGTPEDTYF